MAISSVLTTIGSYLLKGVSVVAKNAISITAKSAAKFVFGGLSIAASAWASRNSARNGLAASPTYQSAQITQTDPSLCVPLLYGTVKTAGNIIWQNNQEKFSQKIIAFSEGEITNFREIRINDIPVESIEGVQIERFYGTNEQEIANLVPGVSLEQKAAVVGSLKNIAYLALTVFNNEKISSDYNLTAIIEGKKIRVYTSLNDYTVKYSENPAWVLFDFLTSYNGLGLALDDNYELDDTLISKIFDINSFLEAASYCDELVNGIPRFTFSLIFDSQTSVRNLLDEIYRCCRGGLFFKNGLLQFKIDKPEHISKIFTVNDISNEVFKTVPSEEHYDILKCVYISPQHEWQQVEAFAEIPEYRNGVPMEHTVNIFSCTNFNQASRLAWYYSNSKILQPYYGSFDTDYRAYDIEVGDVIQFDSILMGLENYVVKVTQIVDDGFGTFTVSWQTYDSRLYADTLGSLEPRVLVTKLNDLYLCPSDVTNFNVVQVAENFVFVWDKIDNVSFEIRSGSDWNSSNVIASNINDNTYICKIDSKGLHTFQIKAFNKYNYSQNSATDVISVDFVPEQNIVLKQNVLDFDGIFNNTYLYNNILKLKIDNLYWQNLNGVWNDVELQQYTMKDCWGAETLSNGSFISQVFDLGKIFNNFTSIDFQSAGSCQVFFKYADDEISLEQKEFQPFRYAQYSFRFYQIKIVLSAQNSEISYIKNVIMNIDVPDKAENFSIEITNADNGYLLDYSATGFYSVPGIVATVTDSINAYAVTAEKTQTTAKIFAITNDGSKTTAKIDVHLFGY